MPSLKSLYPFLIAAATLTTHALAKPAPAAQAAAQVTPGPNAQAVAAAAAASAAQAYSASQSYAAAEAAAEATLNAQATGTDAAAAKQTGPDACGPKVPDPSVPDSCGTYVEEVTTPHAYGVQCLNDGTGQTINTTSCEEIIDVMCSNEFQDAGEWVWATNNGCTLGSYLPSAPGAASWPPQENCAVLIYGAMLDACAGNVYNYAAVNLAKLPDNTPAGSGQQVNAGYPSYLISETQPRNLSDGADKGSGPANQIDVAGILAQEKAAFVSAYLSESKVLATMTGTAVAAMRSDLAAIAENELGS